MRLHVIDMLNGAFPYCLRVSFHVLYCFLVLLAECDTLEHFLNNVSLATCHASRSSHMPSGTLFFGAMHEILITRTNGLNKIISPHFLFSWLYVICFLIFFYILVVFSLVRRSPNSNACLKLQTHFPIRSSIHNTGPSQFCLCEAIYRQYLVSIALCCFFLFLSHALLRSKQATLLSTCVCVYSSTLCRENGNDTRTRDTPRLEGAGMHSGRAFGISHLFEPCTTLCILPRSCSQ